MVPAGTMRRFSLFRKMPGRGVSCVPGYEDSIMTLLQSVFLGIVQGITEFLPVSSSGHLAIMQNIFHIDTGDSILYDVLLHIGTLIVVFYLYRKEIGRLIIEFFGMIRDLFDNIRIRRANRGSDSPVPLHRIVKNNYRKFVILILISTVPTGIMGFLGRKLVADAADTLLVPGICLLITGVILLISDRTKNNTKIPQDVTWREAVIIGIAQGFATLPGLSRSGTTITACLLCGFERSFAVKYSFILSIPAILGAAVLELKDIGSELVTPALAGTYVAGMIAAAVVGYICIRTMIRLIRKKKLHYFAYYCFAAGLLAIVGHFFLT